MAKVKTVKTTTDSVLVKIPAIFTVPLPKDRGSVDIDVRKIPGDRRDSLIAHAIGSAFKRRCEDASAGDSAGMFERAKLIVARLYTGEWNLPGGRSPRDAMAVETLTILARNASQAGLDPKLIAKGTIREGVARVVIAAATKAGKVYTLPELTAVIDRNLAAIEDVARKAIAARCAADITLD